MKKPFTPREPCRLVLGKIENAATWRQKASPAEVLNRWIVPMDRRVDYLTFQNGGKVQVPFETFLIFSTNLKPEQLGDEAFLRRIQYKMLLKSPTEEEFAEIFQRCCAAEQLPLSEGLLARFVWKNYRKAEKRFRRCQPRGTSFPTPST